MDLEVEGMLCLQIGRQSFSCGHVDLASEKNTDPEDVMFFSEAVLPSISDHLTVSQNISFSPNRQISQENTLDQRQKCKIKRQRGF